VGTLGRLYRGETNIDFVGPRKKWYIGSAIATLICVASLAIQGFNFGIEFAGGNQFLVPAAQGTSLEQARGAVEDLGIEVPTAQQAGPGPTPRT
jgi:Preprotein translocase subunit SecF